MKKAILITLSLALILAMGACTPAQETLAPTANPTQEATASPTAKPTPSPTPTSAPTPVPTPTALPTAEPVPTLVLDLPADFILVATNPVTYAAADFSSITIVEAEKDPIFANYTQEFTATYFRTLFENTYPQQKVTLELTHFEYTQAAGLPALRYSSRVTVEGVATFLQTQLLLDGDVSHVITLTDMSEDGQWQGTFDAALASVRFE